MNESETMKMIQAEADAIVAQAREQAAQLRAAADARAGHLSREGEELAAQIESTIRQLQEIAENLRQRLA